MPQTISMVMTVRDAERTLPSAIRSASDLVDEVVVAVDNRSSDKTRETALGLGARVFGFDWTDSFAVARNAPIAHARGDWIFWLDADEFIDESNRARFGALVASLTDENIGYVMTQISRTQLPYPTSGQEFFDQVGQQVRVFRRDPAIRWQFRVFEQIRPSVRASGGSIRETDIVIRHSGLQDIETIRAKAERNLRLALMQHDELPDDPYMLMYIGESLIYLGRPHEAIGYLRRSLALFPSTARARTRTVGLLSAAEGLLGSSVIHIY